MRQTRFRLLILLLSIWPWSIASSQNWAPANPAYQSGFPVVLTGAAVTKGSTTIADANGDGQADAVVGTGDGLVFAVNGSGTILWSFNTGSMAIESKPAVADIDGDGKPETVVGAGSTATPNAHGILYVLDHNGVEQCHFDPNDRAGDSWRDGIFSSPALADLDGNDDGRLEIAFGCYDGFVRVLNHDCSVSWAVDSNDAVWSSPAIGDINGDGQLDVIIGLSSDVNHGLGNPDGGLLQVYNGANGQPLTGFPIWINEVIWSSPSLGDITGDGFLDIVVGTGECWSSASCVGAGNVHPGVGRYINAWDHTGSALQNWPIALPDTYVFASPALADLDGDGALDIIANSFDPADNHGGQVYAWDGSGVSLPGWPNQPTTPTDLHFQSKASPLVADIVGDNGLEVILPSGFELVVWDSAGNQLSRTVSPPLTTLQLRTRFTLAGGAAVGDIDGDHDIEVVVGGSDQGGTPAALFAWDFAKSVAANLAWPQFRATATNQGNVSMIPIMVDGFESGDTSGWSIQTGP